MYCYGLGWVNRIVFFRDSNWIKELLFYVILVRVFLYCRCIVCEEGKDDVVIGY